MLENYKNLHVWDFKKGLRYGYKNYHVAINHYVIELYEQKKCLLYVK